MGDGSIHGDHQIERRHEGGSLGEIGQFPGPVHEGKGRVGCVRFRSALVLLQAYKAHPGHTCQWRELAQRHAAPTVGAVASWVLGVGIARPHQAHPKTRQGGEPTAPLGHAYRVWLKIGNCGWDDVRGTKQVRQRQQRGMATVGR